MSTDLIHFAVAGDHFASFACGDEPGVFTPGQVTCPKCLALMRAHPGEAGDADALKDLAAVWAARITGDESKTPLASTAESICAHGYMLGECVECLPGHLIVAFRSAIAAARSSGETTPAAAPRCAHCPHAPHLGPCTARNGGAANPCPCLHDTAPAAATGESQAEETGAPLSPAEIEHLQRLSNIAPAPAQTPEPAPWDWVRGFEKEVSPAVPSQPESGSTNPVKEE